MRAASAAAPGGGGGGGGLWLQRCSCGMRHTAEAKMMAATATALWLLDTVMAATAATGATTARARGAIGEVS